MLLRDHAPIITATNFVTNSRAKIRFLVDSFISSTLVNYHGQDIVRLKKKKRKKREEEGKERGIVSLRSNRDRSSLYLVLYAKIFHPNPD